MPSPKKIRRLILDTLFPIKCLGCEKEGSWLCDGCVSLLPAKDEQYCPICEKLPTPSGRICFGCKKKSSLDALLTVFPYGNALVSRAVHYYKYRFIPELHESLGSLLADSLLKSDLPIPDLIIPVPLHPRRLRWRGFNQSELLAARISEKITPGFAVPVCADALVRKRYTAPQMEIKEKARRQENISDAFALASPAEIKDKNILLVDDVATTGSTLFECARVLKAAGANQVWAVVIARQEIKRSPCKNRFPTA